MLHQNEAELGRYKWTKAVFKLLYSLALLGILGTHLKSYQILRSLGQYRNLQNERG